MTLKSSDYTRGIDFADCQGQRILDHIGGKITKRHIHLTGCQEQRKGLGIAQDDTGFLDKQIIVIAVV